MKYCLFNLTINYIYLIYIIGNSIIIVCLIISLCSPDAPVCQSSEPTIVGASVNEAVRVKCLVSADPMGVTFAWKFNNNGEDFSVNPAKYSESNSTSSDLMYTPLSERDYGTLACWGRNHIGAQAEPCTFQVMPAGEWLNLVLLLLTCWEDNHVVCFHIVCLVTCIIILHNR